MRSCNAWTELHQKPKLNGQSEGRTDDGFPIKVALGEVTRRFEVGSPKSEVLRPLTDAFKST